MGRHANNRAETAVNALSTAAQAKFEEEGSIGGAKRNPAEPAAEEAISSNSAVSK